jgi:hypothetical protein
MNFMSHPSSSKPQHDGRPVAAGDSGFGQIDLLVEDAEHAIQQHVADLVSRQK